MKYQDWPTKSEMKVLSLLMNAPNGLYGLEIVEQSGGVIKRGSVYVLLARLEEKGYVTQQKPKTAPSHPGLPRPIYKLTAPGKQVQQFAGEIGINGVFA